MDIMIPQTASPGTYDFRAEGFQIGISNAVPFTITPGPTCNVQLNQTTFTNGDQIILQTMKFSNPTSAGFYVEYKYWVDIPGGQTFSEFRGGSDGLSFLVPGYEQDLGPVTLATVDSSLSRGDYSFGCRFMDPIKGNVLMQSVQKFTIQ
jgi:hypothetical protein